MSVKRSGIGYWGALAVSMVESLKNVKSGSETVVKGSHYGHPWVYLSVKRM